MRSLFHLFSHDDTYGPGTDLAMALLGIFIVSAAISKKSDADKNTRLDVIAGRQMEIVNSLAANYNTVAEYATAGNDTGYLIATSSSPGNKIVVKNAETSQLITFGEGLLFEIGQAQLKPEGEPILANIGRMIQVHADYIEEIQIQGHADTIPPNVWDLYRSNIELASARATTVFEFFKQQSGIDPAKHLISIVSYGEYKPVQRHNRWVKWDRALLNEANNSGAKRSKNRRIEIVLIYK